MIIKKVNDQEIIKNLFVNYDEIINKWINKKIDIYYMEDDDIIGRIIVDYENRFLEKETIKDVRACLSYLFIKKEYRKKGYASTLVDYVINDLTNKGYKEFTIGVESQNIPAINLYKSKGFNQLIDHSDNPFPFDLYLKIME